MRATACPACAKPAHRYYAAALAAGSAVRTDTSRWQADVAGTSDGRRHGGTGGAGPAVEMASKRDPKSAGLRSGHGVGRAVREAPGRVSAAVSDGCEPAYWHMDDKGGT